jgi:hypothetical protein
MVGRRHLQQQEFTVLRIDLPIPVAMAIIASLAANGVAVAAVIEGEIAFPSPSMPSMTAYVCEADTSRIRKVPIAENQSKFSVEVPPGRYVVFLAPNEPGDPNIYGAHTQYSVCTARAPDGARAQDASCEDHSLVALSLNTKAARVVVSIDDWYLSDDIAAQLDRIRGIDASAGGEPLGAPRFSEYRAEAYETTVAPKLDADGTALPAEDRTRLQQAFAGTPNFAGSMSLVLTRCGIACDHVVLLDWRSGKMFEPPAVSEIQGSLPCRAEEAVMFRRDSRLISVTRTRADAIVTQYFVWKPETGTLVPAAEYQRTMQQFCAVMPP